MLDDVYENPDYVRAVALSLDYSIPRGNYPGRFALISIFQRVLLKFINAVMTPHLGVELEYHPYCRDLTFAVITLPGTALTVAQRQPHYDSFCDVAGVLFLNPDEQCSGGTSFWRHRVSDSSALPDLGDRDDEKLASQAIANAWLGESSNGLQSGYIDVSNAQWELLHVVPMKFNRLVLYSGRLFHTPHYDERRFGDVLPTRRLTQNLYLNVRRIDAPNAETA